MDFAEAVEWIKLNLGVDNGDICAALGMGEVMFENLITGYAKPQPTVVQKLFSRFSVLPEDDPPIVSRTVSGELNTAQLDSRLRRPLSFGIEVQDDALAERHIFAGCYVVIHQNVPLACESVILASVRGGEPLLYIYGTDGGRTTLSRGGEKLCFGADEFRSDVRVIGTVAGVLEKITEEVEY